MQKLETPGAEIYVLPFIMRSRCLELISCFSRMEGGLLGCWLSVLEEVHGEKVCFG